ncbi:MAG: LamG domain-containing protein, partial [Nannocystaceae bacterium]
MLPPDWEQSVALPEQPAPTPDPLFKEGSLRFDGQSSYLKLGGGVHVGTQFTIELWIRPRLSDDKYYGVLGSSEASSATRSPCIWLVNRTGLHGGFSTTDGQWLWFDAHNALAHDVWQHVAITFDGTNFVVYVNGEVVLTPDKYAGQTPADSPIEVLGVSENTYSPVDTAEVRLWSHPRSQAELRADMNRRLVGPQEALVGYWPLNEGTGELAEDRSGGNNHATLVQAPQWLPDGPSITSPSSTPSPEPPPEPVALKALEFDGVDDYIECKHAIPFSSQVTVEMWVKGGPSQPKPGFLFCFANSNNQNLLSSHAPWADGKLYFDGGNAGTNRISKMMSLPEQKGTWNHWAFVRDRDAGRMAVYKNGQLWLEKASGLTNSMSGSTRFVIAARHDFKVAHAGAICEFRVWSTARSEAEIRENMHHPLVEAQPDLLVSYALGESGNCLDRSGNEYHGTVHGAPAVVDSPSELVPPVIVPNEDPPDQSTPEPAEQSPESEEQPSTALQFDGSDDYIECKHAIPFSSQVTVEMWMKGGPSQPKAGFLFYFADKENQRLLSGAPWVNGVLYFDGGWKSGGLDRIEKRMSLSEQKGTWNHWAFVRDRDAGRMAIYKNGQLWLERASGLTQSMSGCTRFVLAARYDFMEAHAGAICEFRVWGTARSQAEIQENMNHPLVGAQPGLLVSYALGESGNCLDRSGNGRHGTLHGAPVVVDSPNELAPPAEEPNQEPVGDVQPSTALRFDGVDDYLTAQRSLLNNHKTFTIEGWIKREPQNKTVGLFGQNDAIEIGIDVQQGFACWLNTGGNGVLLKDSQPMPSGSWQHVAVSCDDLKLRLYVNGEMRAEASINPGTRRTSNDPFCLGGRVWKPEPSEAFAGEMAEVRVWDHARNADALLATMTRVLSGQEPGLLAYWQLQKQVPDNIPDLAGSAPLQRMSEPTWTSTDMQLDSIPRSNDEVSVAPVEPVELPPEGEEQPSTALRFDGSDDYIECKHAIPFSS